MTEMQPGVYRAKLDFERGFVRAPNEWMRDPLISLKAKGLLIYFLSHESGYMISIDQIVRQTADGTTAIRSAIKELIAAKYLDTQRTHTAKGYNSGLAYILQDPRAISVADEPEPARAEEFAEPECENPNMENPNMENPSAYRKQPLREEKELKNNIGDSTNAQFDLFWNNYPVKKDKAISEKRFATALKLISFEELMAALEAYKADLRRSGVSPAYASTWLNKKRWTDELTPAAYYSPEGRKEIAGEISDRQAQASRESARRAIAEAAEAEAYAKANPAPRCEHNRVAVICDTCNKKTARIKTQQSGGTN